jgi:hypothetical protein
MLRVVTRRLHAQAGHAQGWSALEVLVAAVMQATAPALLHEQRRKQAMPGPLQQYPLLLLLRVNDDRCKGCHA